MLPLLRWNVFSSHGYQHFTNSFSRNVNTDPISPYVYEIRNPLRKRQKRKVRNTSLDHLTEIVATFRDIMDSAVRIALCDPVIVTFL